MSNSDRTKNTIYNSQASLITMIVKYVLIFITRTIFIKYFGEIYLGVNELLTNILYVLSIAELGLSSAIGFSLYKPILNKDSKQISKLMTLFKKMYFFIGIVILILGVGLLFLLPIFVQEYNSISDFVCIYLLYLINTVSTYFISYKDILITADQKLYKLARINILSLIFLFVFQVVSIVVFKNFILYLIINFFIQIIQRVIINKYIGKNYSDIDFNCKEKLDISTKKGIKKNVGGLFFHKVGDYAVNGTDNIIIAYFLNLATVGYYSNYAMITKAVQGIAATIYYSVIPSYGNLVAEGNKEKSLLIFQKLDFLGFTMYSFLGIMFITCINSFMSIWIGEKFVLTEFTVYLISFSFFLVGLRMASFSVKSSAGIFKEDSWSPFVQAIINLVISIILCKFLGLNGVIIGTIVSSIVPNLSRIYYIYKIVFEKKMISYLTNYLCVYIVFFVGVGYFALKICSIFIFSNLLQLFVNFSVTFVVYILLYIVTFRKYDEMNYVSDFLKKIGNKLRRKNEKNS